MTECPCIINSKTCITNYHKRTLLLDSADVNCVFWISLIQHQHYKSFLNSQSGASLGMVIIWENVILTDDKICIDEKEVILLTFVPLVILSIPPKKYMIVFICKLISWDKCILRPRPHHIKKQINTSIQLCVI